MPLIAAALLRQLVIAIISGAAVSAVMNALEAFIDKFKADTKNEYGLNDADNDSLVENIFIDALTASLVLFALLKGRIPVRIADKLKLSSKGYTKRALSKEGEAKLNQKLALDPKGLSLGKKMGAALALSFAGSIPWIPSFIQNILDQGTFNPEAANRAMDSLGLPQSLRWNTPERRAQPGPFDANAFKEYYDALTAAGAVGINAEYANQSQIWSKDNLADLVLFITGQLEIGGAKSTAAEVKKKVAPFIISKGGNGGTFSPLLPTTAPAKTAPAGTVPTQIKIYTGVVANGALGTPQEFIARPDDMINNADELKAAAKNNLASLYQALPGRFYYEIAVVASVRTRAGFTVKGAPVQVVSGYTKAGAPRYKTIYHKFAVMRIFVTDVNGRQVKLQEITLGPVNVVDFQPTPAQLSDVASKITPETFTGDVGEVSQIITQQPVTVTSQPPANPAPAQAPAGGTVTQPSPAPAQGSAVSTPASPPPAPPPVQASSPAPAPAPVAPALTPVQIAVKAATNLSEVYAALGVPLPSINQRANLYQAWGLGPSSTYAGTAEQNNRMLAEIKRQAGVG